MVLRVVKLILQGALLLQLLHAPVSINGLEVENFENTPLNPEADAPGKIGPAIIPDSNDKNFAKQEQRGFFDWITGKNDDTPAPAAGAPTTQGSAPAPAVEDSGQFATITPIPGTPARPTTASFMSKFGSMIDDFTGSKDDSGLASPPSTASGSGSLTTTQSSAKTAATTSASGSEDAAPTKKKKMIAITSASGSDEATTTTKTKKTTKALIAASGSEEDTSDSSLDDLLGSSAESEGDDLSAESGSDAMSSLLGGASGSDDMSPVLGGGSGLSLGSGSKVPSFEEFMKMMGSGSGAMMDLFGDPTVPQNNTVEDDDILLSKAYGSVDGGDAFSDIMNIKFQQMILNVTMRGDKRVDSVGLLVMNQDSVGNLVHGGKGGTEKFIELEMTDSITDVEIHWNLHKGDYAIFYVSITSTEGKTLSIGTKTENTIVLKAPKGYRLGGFYGRKSSDGVSQLGAIWTKVTATDLSVTDIVAIEGGSEDVYNYKTTIRNWVGPNVDIPSDTACYQKAVDPNSAKVCPTGYNMNDDKCVTQCPMLYPVDCLRECIPQNADCTQQILAKVSSVAAVALNVATMGFAGALIATYRTLNTGITCAIHVTNAIKSLIFYLRYKQTTIPATDTEKLMDKAFQLQIVILDLPIAVCQCLGKKIPDKLQFGAMILAVVSGLVMMAVMVGQALFKSSDNIMLMLRESGAMNSTALNGEILDLDTILSKKNGTCGYEMKTLTNRVLGMVNEIRNNTPNADVEDVRVAVSKAKIFTDDIPLVTNNCMGQIWTNKTQKSAYSTRELLRKTLRVITDQMIETGQTDMGKNVVKQEKALEYANMGLFVMSIFDPTGIAWMASEFIQPICGPTNYIGEIDDGTLYEALGLKAVDQAFLGSYGVWKKKGDGSVKVYFESIDKADVRVIIHSGGDTIAKVRVNGKTTVVWESTVEKLQDKTFYLDRWRPGFLGLPGSGGGSMLMWIPRSSQGGQLVLHARINAV